MARDQPSKLLSHKAMPSGLPWSTGPLCGEKCATPGTLLFFTWYVEQKTVFTISVWPLVIRMPVTTHSLPHSF